MDELTERIEEVVTRGSTDEKLSLAEELIADNEFERAQTVLDSANARGAKWHYLQSKIFFNKNWLYESRKQLEIALELEPDNALYIEELEKVRALGAEPEFGKEKLKPELDKGFCKDLACNEVCCEACAYCGAECCCQLACEAIGNGC